MPAQQTTQQTLNEEEEDVSVEEVRSNSQLADISILPVFLMIILCSGIQNGFEVLCLELVAMIYTWLATSRNTVAGFSSFLPDVPLPDLPFDAIALLCRFVADCFVKASSAELSRLSLLRMAIGSS